MPVDTLEFIKGLNWAQMSIALGPAWQVFKLWWWVPLPFLLLKPFLFFWLWWKIDGWLGKVFNPVLLEVRIPKEMLKPIRAMETVMAGIWGATYQPPDWWEKWIEGQVQTSTSFEIVSIGGEVHFYVRIHKPYKDAVEAAIYAQYPGAEIQEVPDYTKNVPSDIPNKDWDLFGSDYRLAKDDSYPIKTYLGFETEHEALEEKIIDPVSDLLEAMSKIKPGEQFWIQIRASPIGADEGANAFIKGGHKIRDKIAGRKEPSKSKPMLSEMADIMLTGKPAGAEAKKEEFIPVEMRLTPGEREIITEVERKISKPVFNCGVRFVYFGKRDVWFKPNFRLAFTYFNSFTTANLNAIVPWGSTITKIHQSWFLPYNRLKPRRHYLRVRKMFINYKGRDNALFPRFKDDKSMFVLNVEELASLFHFPSWRVSPVPGVSRVESRKQAPPPLPYE